MRGKLGRKEGEEPRDKLDNHVCRRRWSDCRGPEYAN